MEEGRDVFAIPGNITDNLSDGCHFLIQEGAKLVYHGRDILMEYDRWDAYDKKPNVLSWFLVFCLVFYLILLIIMIEWNKIM